MKKQYLLTFLLCSLIGFAQIPADYYTTATGTGLTLKTNLKKIIDNVSDGIPSEHLHSDQGYPALWTLYTHTAFRDNYYENDGSLLDIYSENPSGADPYIYANTSQQCGTYSSEGDCYNREHLIPQSYFDGYATNPMKNDPFFVVPSDGKVNGDRNNLPFGEVGTATYTSQNGSKRGNGLNSGYALGYSGVVFEPIDEFKGDVARAFFYFATRYESDMTNFYNAANAATCQAKNMFDGSTGRVFANPFLDILVQWHINDPVSAKEIAINNDIYYNHQSNRNPYIDHPEYVGTIWNSFLENDSFTLENTISIHPNPAINNEITISSVKELNSIVLYNINGQIIQEIKNPTRVNNSYKVSNLPNGFYLVQMASENAVATKKVIVN
ncbi:MULTISPECIES: endonuclease [unclassified Flavobacterium]|uniref:endonuclease n=1 Tax=unclassified Flavobacterium TaxID=196869 RepID=UPI0012929A11|nr:MULTISPECIES: endonuclease [unclassified Flavobacterium]MQP52331.1 T9SS type A sorting domain-containing protein [Flavobacterium sp. LMO9]MQP62401.1 T9SS type A sorting domain-containing protein [Flavobacterium sp. LMO6]